MEIHKPKPWHNWREFLKELGTIALGVGIALGAEQAVEWMHWRAQVSEARASIRAEMSVNNLIYYAFREAIAPCVERKTDKAQAVIAALQAHRAPPPLAGLRAGLRAAFNDSEWQTARASQVLTHFPKGEMTLMSSYYTAQQLQLEYLATEGTAWNELSVLQDVPAGITASDIIRFKVNLAAVRRVSGLIERNSQRVLAISERLGLPRTRLDPSRVLSVKYFCSDMSLEDYRRWQSSPEAPQNPMPAAP